VSRRSVLAKQMGTSLEMIEDTYGHLMPNAADATRVALEGWIARTTDADTASGH